MQFLVPWARVVVSESTFIGPENSHDPQTRSQAEARAYACTFDPDQKNFLTFETHGKQAVKQLLCIEVVEYE